MRIQNITSNLIGRVDPRSFTMGKENGVQKCLISKGSIIGVDDIPIQENDDYALMDNEDIKKSSLFK